MWIWLSLRTSLMLGLMPQLRRPDYQPPQTLACHVAPRGSPEDGRHVTATSLLLSDETGGPSALPKSPSYRWRTVKGHCVEVSEALRRWGVSLGLGWRDANLLGNTNPSLSSNLYQEKGHNVVPFAVTKVTMLDHFFWVMRGRGKWGAMWLAKTPQGLWGVNAGLFIFFSIALNGEENLFPKMKLKGHSVDHKQCSSQTVKKETYNVALKTSLFLVVCVFYCLPITAMWM